jgi:hypothetical protein
MAKKAFEYRPPTKDKLQERSNQKGGAYDTIFAPTVKIWKCTEGDKRIRIMPATWEGADHYGLDLFIHGYVGADRGTYICPAKNGENGKCCVCEAARIASDEGDNETAGKLKARKVVCIYLIDRDNESEGPQIWQMGWMNDRDIAAVCIDRRTNEVFLVDDPEGGFDVEFRRVGKGQFDTRYTNIRLSRRPCPLSDDPKQQEDWLQFIVDNSIPDLLIHKDNEYISQQFDAEPRAEEAEQPEPRHAREPEKPSEPRRPAEKSEPAAQRTAPPPAGRVRPTTATARNEPEPTAEEGGPTTEPDDNDEEIDTPRSSRTAPAARTTTGRR